MRTNRHLAALAAGISIILATLGAGPPCAQAQNRQGPPDGSFSIALPGGWTPIPALELYLFEHPGQSGPVAPEELARLRNTRLGFQAPADMWFTLRYIIISLETGRKRGPQDLFMESVMAERDSGAQASGSGHRFREKEHQPLKRLAYYKDVAYSAAQGRNVAMGVYTYLTSQGFLRVCWYVGETELRYWENALHAAAMSVTLSPGLEYKPEGRK